MMVSVPRPSWANNLLAILFIAIALSACSNGQDDSSATSDPVDAVANGDRSQTPNGATQPPTFSGSAEEDKAALATLLESLGSRPSWADDDGLLNDVPAEERIGVMTDENSRVVGLLLSNHLLSGGLPPELGNLAALRWLDLSYNQITGGLPRELEHLTNLEGLLLSGNLLTGPLPSELGRLDNLRVLRLSDNQLRGGIPIELGDLAGLQELNLGSNELGGNIPPELGELTDLQSLDLSHNKLTGEIPASFGNLTSLQWLNLANNELSGEIPLELQALSKEKGLQVAEMYLLVDTTVPYSALAELENDSSRLPGLLDQATECRGGLRFPKDSFCLGGGRYILGHDADGRMVVRDLHWQRTDSAGTIEETFKLLDEGTIPGHISSPTLSANFSSPDGDFAFEASQSAIYVDGRGVRAVVTSYTADRELWASVYEGDLDRIRELVGKGANINARDSHGATLLERAVSDGDIELVTVLLEVGVDVNLNTPLVTAIDSGHTEIVRILVEAGADVNAKDPWNDHPWGGNLLDNANRSGNQAIIEILIGAGAVSAWPDQEMWQPAENGRAFYSTDAAGLYDAVADDDAESVRSLIEAGVDVNAKTAGGESILTNAVIRASPEVVHMLVEAGADVNAKDNLGRPVLFEAISPYDWGPAAKEVLQILVDAGADVNAKNGDGRPLLAEAIQPGNILTDYPEIVRVLVDAGAEVNALDEHGRPVIFLALLESYEVYEGAYNILRMLIDAGADVNAQDDRGPVLLEAVRNGDPEVVRLLVDGGADINVTDDHGDPMLYSAMIEGNPEIVGLLVDAGADVNATVHGAPILFWARGNPEIVRLLVDAGAKE